MRNKKIRDSSLAAKDIIMVVSKKNVIMFLLDKINQ